MMSILLFNHKDAWAVTLGIALVCLISHQAISISSLLLAGAITVAYWLGFAVNDYCDAGLIGWTQRKRPTISSWKSTRAASSNLPA